MQVNSELDVTQLKCASSLALIIQNVNQVFLQGTKRKCLNKYLLCNNYNRHEDCSIDNYHR